LYGYDPAICRHSELIYILSSLILSEWVHYPNHPTSVNWLSLTSTRVPHTRLMRSARDGSPHRLRRGVRLRSASACRPLQTCPRPSQRTIKVSAWKAIERACICINHTTLTHSAMAIGNPKKGTWCIQDNINTKLAISTTLARRRRPSVYVGLRVQMDRANPVASSTSSSACPIEFTELNGSMSRILRLPSQEVYTVGSSTCGFSEQRSIEGIAGT
jgi:hypothetical protein